MSNIISRAFHRVAKAIGYDLVRIKRNHQYLYPHLLGLLSRHGVDCVIDVGANVGQYASHLRAQGYRGRIVSFEPSRVCFEALEKACSSDPLWDVHNMALGAADGELEFTVMSSNVFSSFRSPSSYGKEHFSEAMKPEGVELVPVKRLDGIFDDLVLRAGASRVFLKMDTQGFDSEVFAGARGCMKHIVGLQSEIPVRRIYSGVSDYLDILAEYRQEGFEVTGFFPVTREQTNLVLIEFDVVMVRGADG